MMEVGFSEILLISVLALIVLGPEKLPKVAAEIGRWVGRARSMARQFRDQLEDEASLEPTIKKPAASTAVATAAAAEAQVSGAETPASPPPAEVHAESYATPEDWAANNAAAPEITPDHAELNPHPPMLDDYVPEPDAQPANAGVAEVALADSAPRP